MKIGIVCAAEKELVPFLPQIKDIKASEKAMLKFYEAMECCYHDVAENICTGRSDAQYEKKPSRRRVPARGFHSSMAISSFGIFAQSKSGRSSLAEMGSRFSSSPAA